MKLWTRFGCLLTGWNHTLLSQCSEASKSQLNKYTSALVILMIIWSIIGFCFAQRYMGFPIWGCAMVSLVFVTIIIMIERQILLSINPSKWLAVFRCFIAILMAIVGSTIFDQTMFGKDINKQMSEIIEIQTAELTSKRVAIIEEKLATLKKEKETLENANYEMQAEVNANPWITQKSVTNSQQKIVVDGEIKTVNNPSVTTNQVANPKIETIKNNNAKIQDINIQEREWSQKKLSVEEDTREECKANIGFLEELEAMVTIITSRTVAGMFYLIFFLLLFCLELFILVSKKGDKECDYEMAVKLVERIKVEQFGKTLDKMSCSSSSL